MEWACHAPSHESVAVSHSLVVSTAVWSVLFWLRFQAASKSFGNFIYFRRAPSIQDSPRIPETTYTKYSHLWVLGPLQGLTAIFNVRLFKQQQLLVNLTIKMGQSSEAASAVWSPGPRLQKINNWVGVLLLKGCCFSSSSHLLGVAQAQPRAWLSTELTNMVLTCHIAHNTGSQLRIIQVHPIRSGDDSRWAWRAWWALGTSQIMPYSVT